MIGFLKRVLMTLAIGAAFVVVAFVMSIILFKVGIKTQ